MLIVQQKTCLDLELREKSITVEILRLSIIFSTVKHLLDYYFCLSLDSD